MMTRQDIEALRTLDGQITVTPGLLITLIASALWFDPVIVPEQEGRLRAAVEQAGALVVDAYPHLEQIIQMAIAEEVDLL
jgi:hypothetical protein